MKDKGICLIYRDSLSTLKSLNLKRHYKQKHSEIKDLTGGERKAKLELLKANLTTLQNIFQKQNAQSNYIVTANFRISHIYQKNETILRW